MSQCASITHFSCLEYEVCSSQNQSDCRFLRKLVVQTVNDKHNYLYSFYPTSLQIKYNGSEPVTINFTNKFIYASPVLDSFYGAIPFYLNLTQFHKNVVKRTSSYLKEATSKYPYIKIYLDIYNLLNKKIGYLLITPNSNVLFDDECFVKQGIKISEISYFKLSLVITESCKINLNYFVFGFSDFMSTDTFYSKNFDVTVRLQVNNIKNKKNGVIIFFPSFYIKERGADHISHMDNSVRWPNFTRHTWGNDLDNVCTIFVSDPFQYVNGNSRSSWFFASNGQSILSEVAAYIKKILCIQNENFSKKKFHNFFDKYGFNKACGPIINYGSSMGGFAAFLFSCYLEPTLCFCECPQANLIKYKYSKEYLETCSGLGLNDIPLLLSSYPANERNKKKEQIVLNIVQKYDLSLSAILRNHKPKFRSLIHFYSIDKLHLTSFDNEIQSLTDEERKQFNYQLVIENDLENQLFSHQAMPKDKVLEIFKYYLTNSK